MARPLKPLVRGGGFYPSRKWTPLVYNGGYTTMDGGEEPEPLPIEKTVIGNPIHILDALAKPVQALSVKLEPIQDLHGYDNPWPAGGGVNKFSGQWPPDVSGIYAGWYSGATTSCAIRLFDKGNGADISGVYLGASVNGSGTPVIWLVINGDINRTLLETSASGTLFPYIAMYPNKMETLEKVLNRFDVLVAIDGADYSTYSPYENICPISGHTDADVIVSPTPNPADGTTYPIPLGQTVYGGTLDATAGTLTVDRAISVYDGSSDEAWAKSGTGTYVLVNASVKGDTTPISNLYLMQEAPTSGYTIRPIGNDNFANVTEWKTFLSQNNLEVVYELATPQTIQLTPTQVELLLGENNIWSDGTMTLVYLADGNASDEEALNILLGGRYVNNHGEDEPSDREALNIILGGNER